MLGICIRDPADVAPFDGSGLRHVQTWYDVTGAACAYGYVGPSGRWIRWPELVAFRFDEEGTIDAFPERNVDSAYVLALARRTVVPLVLQALGWETLHASAVQGSDGAIGFCGERESGKSTLAYTLGRRGYRQLADDMLVLDIGRGVHALELPFDVRLRAESCAYFGVNAGRGPFTDIASIDPRRGEATANEPLSALFVLHRIDRGEPTVTRLSPTAAFTAVVAHLYCFDPHDAGARRRLLEHYLEIAASVPVYELRFAGGLDGLEAVMACIEDAIGGYAELTEDACCEISSQALHHGGHGGHGGNSRNDPALHVPSVLRGGALGGALDSAMQPDKPCLA